MTSLLRRFGVALALASLLAQPALAQVLTFNGTRTLDNGTTVTGPVAVSTDNPLPVTGGGGGGGGGTEYTEDAAAAANPVGGALICVRRDTPTASEVSADGDNVAAKCSNTGALRVDGSNVTQPISAAAIEESLGGAGTTAYSGTGTGDLNRYLRAIANTALDTTPSTVNLTQVGGSTIATGSGASNAQTIRTMPASDSAIGLAAPTTGGCTLSGTQSAASNNATNVKSSAGILCGGTVINTTATVYYLRFYNLSSSPTCSSATGFVATYPIPASTSGAGTVLNVGTYGAAFATGIGFCLTGGGSSTDNVSAATGVYINLTYK